MALKFVLLTLLNREPQSGYEIVKTFESSVGYFWSASHQQVYRELSGMTDKGLLEFVDVRQGDKPDKKIYSTTGEGKKALTDWLQAPIKQSPVKDLLLVKLLSLNEKNADILLAELDQAFAEAAERQKVYQHIERTHYSADAQARLSLSELPLYLALRRGLVGLESYLEWLSETQSAIRRQRENSRA